MNIKVAIIEDNRGLQESLSVLVSGTPGYTFVGAFSDAESALEAMPSLHPDVILMDINLPGMSGIECTARLKMKMPGVQIIIQTVYEESDKIFESLRAGATGYLLKRTPPAKILEAIQDVYNGGSPMSGEIARMVVHSFHNSPPAEGPLPELTKRENELLELITKGYRYQEIADKLFISKETVRTHLRNVYDKLQVRSRSEAALRYLRK